MTRLSSVLQLQMRLTAITNKLPVMSWEWWRCIEIRHSRWSRLKYQTSTSFLGEVKEQHRPLQLVEVSPRWTLCRFASLGFHELRGIVVPRLSEKIVRDTRLIITAKLQCNKRCMVLPFAFEQKKVKFCRKQMTWHLDALQWNALGAFHLELKQIILFFSFPQCDL